MDGSTACHVAAITKRTASFGGQLASVFHNHALSAEEKLPRRFDSAVNVLDATVTTLNQVLSLLEEEIGQTTTKEGNSFSHEGLTYVQLLATECAAALVKIEPIVADACLSRRMLKSKQKLAKKASAQNGNPNFEVNALNLDAQVFLETIENANWNRVTSRLENCLDRLYSLQLHLLLLFQVVTVGRLSRDFSSGQVDIKRIVTYHDRITRTAVLVGIKLPGEGSTNRRSSYDTSSESDSDSDDFSVVSLKPKKKAPLKSPRLPITLAHRDPPAPPRLPYCPPPPPPANWAGPAPITMQPVAATPKSAPSGITTSNPDLEAVKPPAYSESHKSNPSPSARSAASAIPSTLVGSVSGSIISDTPTQYSNQPSIFPANKEVKQDHPEEKKDVAEPVVLEPRLFRSKSNGIGFKIKSLFRSKYSLAEEMKKALSDSDSHLKAFILRNHDLRPVPHSAFHSLEATHMRTILSQLDDHSWYKTFTALTAVEHQTMTRLLHPYVKGQYHDRDVVVLKVVQQNKSNAWMVLLRDILKLHSNPYGANDRVILAIVREKLIDGKPLETTTPSGIHGLPPPPPPPPGFVGMPYLLAIRPPPGLPTHRRQMRISDLASPGLPPPSSSDLPRPPMRGPPPPPATLILGSQSNSTRISDTTPLTDYDATQALTTYIEYTLRLIDPPNLKTPRTWARVSITQESTERHLLLQRIQAFQQKGGNIIEKKLRMTEQQDRQVTRVMDELLASERDFSRFEWNWAEISLYNHAGEIEGGPGSGAAYGTATTMHLIAKRMPKAHCKPMELYNSLMAPPKPPLVRPQPPLGGPNSPHGPPIMVMRPKSPSPKKKKTQSKYMSDSSDSDSSSSGGSVRSVKRLRRGRMWEKSAKGKEKRVMDIESESGSEAEDEDAIKIKLDLKKGDDVVNALLDMWTPQGDGNGKDKATA